MSGFYQNMKNINESVENLKFNNWEREKFFVAEANKRQNEYTKDINANNRLLAQFAIDYAKLVIKSSLMIHGGGAVALLAFLGNAVGHKYMSPCNIEVIICSIKLLSLACLADCLCACFSYLSQDFYIKEFNDGYIKGKFDFKWGQILKLIAISFIVLSYILFICSLYNLDRLFFRDW